MTVFVDTFALLAWLNSRDDDHAAVTAYLDSFTGRLLTTEWVLMELADETSGSKRKAGYAAQRTVSPLWSAHFGLAQRVVQCSSEGGHLQRPGNDGLPALSPGGALV
jgi:predicted nucleic acid-binding protein